MRTFVHMPHTSINEPCTCDVLPNASLHIDHFATRRAPLMSSQLGVFERCKTRPIIAQLGTTRATSAQRCATRVIVISPQLIVTLLSPSAHQFMPAKLKLASIILESLSAQGASIALRADRISARLERPYRSHRTCINVCTPHRGVYISYAVTIVQSGLVFTRGFGFGHCGLGGVAVAYRTRA